MYFIYSLEEAVRKYGEHRCIEQRDVADWNRKMSEGAGLSKFKFNRIHVHHEIFCLFFFFFFFLGRFTIDDIFYCIKFNIYLFIYSKRKIIKIIIIIFLKYKIIKLIKINSKFNYNNFDCKEHTINPRNKLRVDKLSFELFN